MIDFTRGHLTDKARMLWLAAHQECEGYTFIPNGPQFDFIRAIGECKDNGKIDFLMTSANGGGKSTAWIMAIANIWWPGLNMYQKVRDVQTNKTYNGFFDFPLYKQWPRGWPKMFWLIAKQGKMDGINKKIKQWWPEGRYKQFKGHYDYYSKYISDLGFELHCLTRDMEWLSFEGDDIGLIACDEPCKKWQHDAGLFRLRMGGIMATAATAVHESGWFQDSIIEKAQIPYSDKWHQAVHVDENSVDKGGQWDLGIYGVQNKGVLGRKEIDMLKRECPRELYPARIEGKLTFLSGVIFKSYKSELHFREEISWQYHPAHYMYRMIIDDHLRRPPFIAWLRLDRAGDRVAITEWPNISDPTYEYLRFHEISDRHPMTVFRICQKIIEIEEELKIPGHRMERLFDPKFAKQPHPNKTGSTIVEFWQEESERAYAKRGGYKKGHQFSFILEVNNSLEAGHEVIRDLLLLEETGRIGFKLNPRECHNIDYAFRNYRWKDQPPDQVEWKGLSEKVEEKVKDPIDVVRYGNIVPWTWKPNTVRTIETEKSDDYRHLAYTLARRDRNGKYVPHKPRGVS